MNCKMRDHCQSTDITESKVDLVFSKNVNASDISWRNVTKMQIDSARSNFTNPILKANNYDSIVVILDTKKPCSNYKYPITRPVYKSNMCGDLSKISLQVCLKQNEGSQVVADDTIQLDDSILMKELNQEYKKMMQISELFNSPNRTIKLNESYGCTNEIVEEVKSSEPDNEDNMHNISEPDKQDNMTIEILKNIETEDKENVEVSEAIIPLPMENFHQKLFDAATSRIDEITSAQNSDSSPEPKKVKLSPNYNCTVTSETLVPNHADRQSIFIYRKLPLNVDENFTITSTAAKIQPPKSLTHIDDICSSTSTTLMTNIITTEQPERERKNFSSNINNCASTSIVTVQDSITNCSDSERSNLTENGKYTTISSSSIFIFPKVNKLPPLSSMDDNLMSNSTASASTTVSTFPKVYSTPISSNKNCTITSSMTDATKYSALTPNHNSSDSKSLKTPDNCTNTLNELSEEFQISDNREKLQVFSETVNSKTLNKFSRKHVNDAKSNLQIRNVDPPSTFPQPRALKSNQNEKTVNNLPVRDEFIIYNSFNEQFKPCTSKGVKRSHPQDCSNYKRFKIDKKASFEEPLLIQENKSEGDSKSKLYHCSTPQEYFEAVRNQWGYGSLPNPHEDLTCRFYDSLPKYSTNFTITGATTNTIECFTVYECQIKELDLEINSIKLYLNNLGNNLSKRAINKKLDRWNYLKSMRNRLCDALDDAKRFYRYYKDVRTDWNARHISEYHRNEIKQVLDMLSKYNDFYGYS